MNYLKIIIVIFAIVNMMLAAYYAWKGDEIKEIKYGISAIAGIIVSDYGV